MWFSLGTSLRSLFSGWIVVWVSFIVFVFFKFFLIKLFQFSKFFPLYPYSALPHQPFRIPTPLSSCPWVVHIKSYIVKSYTIFYLSPSILCVGGSSTLRAPPATTDENKSTKTWSAWEGKWLISQRRRAKSLFLSGLLLGLIHTGIQVKLINHC